MLHVASSACLYCLSDRLCFYLSAGCLFYPLCCFFCLSASQLPDALTALPNCQSVHLLPELSPCPCPSAACCMIHLLPCPCPSAGMLHDPSLACLCSSEGMLHDLSPVLPLNICQHAEWSISCLPFLSICRHAEWSISWPAFPVRLLAFCMINLLACLFCPSVGLMHAKSPALPLLFVCWPAAWSVSFFAISIYLSAWCMLYLLPFLSIWQHSAWSISCPAFTVRLLACCMINLLLCHFYLSVSLLPDLPPALPLLSICRPAAWPSLALPLLSGFRPDAWSTSCPAQRWYDTNGRFQMQGGKNWIFRKEMNECKPVLLGLSFAGNLVKPLFSLYGTVWRERGDGLSFETNA